jgi:mono/diheme cytochrome c family protein
LNRTYKIYLLALLAVLLIPVSAQALPWSWDFFTQPSHKGQEEKARPMPVGTVPVKGNTMKMDNMSEGGKVKNPERATKASIERGRERYKIYCFVCHGATGRGDGPVGKKYVPPTDLTSAYVQNKSAGEIFYAITYGGLGIMPKYNDAIEPEDRWHIANYILNEITNEKAEKAK